MLLALSVAGGISAAGYSTLAADCSNLVLSMADCLSYVTARGTTSKLGDLLLGAEYGAQNRLAVPVRDFPEQRAARRHAAEHDQGAGPAGSRQPGSKH
ncbi:non-specific lipid-transfer protein-like protein at5g64080 [Phtheirospermum japonicum]|uniref:Non-specific lipid-transfer protein-like protein at5g64080 n=2 Tax=Phtheirospermum japonicum TaxID=374723 RepID=A0A830CNH9_9LAMI|nr:non-specific lipid-transfer protein-like protein at5g64080 [Phtheirospermum japonicum]